MKQQLGKVISFLALSLAVQSGSAAQVTTVLQKGLNGYQGFGDCYFYTTDGGGEFGSAAEGVLDPVNGEFTWVAGGA